MEDEGESDIECVDEQVIKDEDAVIIYPFRDEESIKKIQELRKLK